MIKLKEIYSDKEPDDIKRIRECENPSTQVRIAQRLIKERYDCFTEEQRRIMNTLYCGTKGNKKQFWKILQEKNDKIK